MAQQSINIGSEANDGTGDQLRTAFDKVNDNFDEVYAGAIDKTGTALTSGATIDLTAAKHTLTTALSAITFTVSFTGEDIVIEITLNATSSTLTFPAGSLCVSDGEASGDNTCALSGASGDKYIVALKKIGSVYYVAAKNFGQ